MTTSPSFDDIFAAMAAASVGHANVRVAVPADAAFDDVPTRFALGLNVLLDDLSFRMGAVERMADRFRVLAEASREFSEATQDRPRLLDTVARRVGSTMKDCCVVLLASDDDRELVLGALHSPDDDDRRHLMDVFAKPLLLAGHPLARRVHESGQPYRALAKDLAELRADTTPDYFELVQSMGVHSVMVVPLRARGHSIGQIVVARHLAASGPFDEHDATLAGAMADHAALAIDNARLFEARKAAEARASEARASEATFRSLVEAAPDAVVIVDGAGAIVLVNWRAESIFGYAREDLVGRPAELLIAERFRRGHESRLAGYFQKARARPPGGGSELRGLRKDGTEFPLEFSVGMVETAEGTLLCSSIRDITERRRSEVALVQAKDAAEAANRELEAFSYSVAHDLRAPLRGMNGFAQVLLDTYGDKLDADGRDWLQEITLNARKMGGLIDALLSLARLNRSELRLERVDLSNLVREVAADLCARDPRRSVAFEIEDGLRVEIDGGLARALVENLLGNAWKFTGKVTGDARIAFGAAEENGSLSYFVRDNGAGFDMAFAGKLFAPFQRLHTVVEFPGTGIGLATAQRIVRRHGGRIWADGAIGVGATFHFTLPG